MCDEQCLTIAAMNVVVLADVLEERVQGNRPCNLASIYTPKASSNVSLTLVSLGGLQLWMFGCMELFTRTQ